ncbi:hypothetical protein BDV26DRAFT_300258 [Aspergillus bertholletiae]|uniref:F-box domain-containing protein n=1 Tax=Aspergillus bertholletiae TaxID=1226010 RepID=A0A5N7AXC2_9EURO|nr:hypothetical protein BDV26DRAFT_300258 [Aspergillus bertholletiae]
MARTRSQRAELASSSNKVGQRKKSLRNQNSAGQTKSNLQGDGHNTRRIVNKHKPTYLEQTLSEREADPNRNLRLFCLPREIFDQIIDHLLPDAEACFSLTCKEALHRLGTASWSIFRGRARYYGLHYGYYGSLVQLLQRDMPGSEYCPRCETLHPPLKPPRDHRETKWTKLCMGQLAIIDYWPQTPSGGYSLVWEHILEAFKSQPSTPGSSPPIPSFSGDFTFNKDTVNYRMCSSAQWIDRNFILIHEHHLRNSNYRSRPLQAAHINGLPFRLCAHLSTAPVPPKKISRATKPVSNIPLLSRAIATVSPPNLQKGVPRLNTDPGLVGMEMKDDLTWRCKSCATKFRVRYDGHNMELVVTAWHCLGRELWKAQQLWTYLVRREGPTLGPAKRNSEYHSVSRSLPDFKISDDI